MTTLITVKAFPTWLLHQWFQEKGIYHQLTVPYQSFSNGKAERFHQTIQAKARTMLIGANMPDKFWSEAALCAVYLINRTPTRVRHTPFELFHGETPGYKHLRVFGFTGYATVPAAVRDGKLSDTAQRAAMFIEEDMFFKASTAASVVSVGGISGSVITDGLPTGGISVPPPSRTIAKDIADEVDTSGRPDTDSNTDDASVIASDSGDDFVPDSTDAPFITVRRGFKRSARSASISSTESSAESCVKQSELTSNPFGPLSIEDVASSNDMISATAYEPDPLNLLASLENSASEREIVKKKHIRTKRFKAVISKAIDETTVPVVEEVDESNDESESSNEVRAIEAPTADDANTALPSNPSSVNSTVGFPVNYAATAFLAASTTNQVPVTYKQAMKLPNTNDWKVAFDAEWDALVENETFEYVDCPPGIKPIRVRWVCVVKDSGLLKARLVAKGFTQVEGIDYTETFAPVIHYEAVRLLLSVAAEKSLVVEQLDVSNVFLNGTINENLYIEEVAIWAQAESIHLESYHQQGTRS